MNPIWLAHFFSDGLGKNHQPAIKPGNRFMGRSRKAFAQFLAGHFRAPELNLDRSGLTDPAAKVVGGRGWFYGIQETIRMNIKWTVYRIIMGFLA